MTEPVEIALIVSVPPTVLGIATFIMSLKNNQKVNEVHVLVNSKMSAALARIDELEGQLKSAVAAAVKP